jgi:hypothetical protein
VNPRPEPRKLRTYKCENEIYDAAMAKVDRLSIRGGLSTLIRNLLEEWAADDEGTTEQS